MAFPSSPTDGQVFNNYKYDSSKGLWKRDGNLDINNLSVDGSFSVDNRFESGAFNNHYCSGVMLLIPYYDGVYAYESEVNGRFTFRRGAAYATNRLEMIDVSAKTAYNSTYFRMSRLLTSWGWAFCKVTYNGNDWLALKSGINIQDARWEFWGKRTISTERGHDPNDQFRVIAYLKEGASSGNGILNQEVHDSLEILQSSTNTFNLWNNGWVSIDTFLNNWEQHPTLSPVACIRNQDNMIELTGCIHNGTANTYMFQLPNGYRPTIEKRVAGGLTNFGVAQCQITTDGYVSFPASDSTLDHWIDGIRFKVD